MAQRSSPPFAIEVVATPGTVLGAAAIARSPETHVLDPIALNPDVTRWDISWQNRTAFWDELHRELQFMGKPQASAGGLYRSPHWIYDEATDQWRETTSAASNGKFGHIWGVAFDHTDDVGRYYYIEQDAQATDTGPEDLSGSVRYMDRSVEAGQGSANAPWTRLPDASYEVHPPNIQGFLTYHPNLLGPGNRGLYVVSGGWGGFNFYDFETGTWTRTKGNYQTNTFRGPSVYVPAHDVAVIGDSNAVVKVLRAGSGAETVDETYAAPIAITTGTGDHGKIMIDPRNDGTIMLLESRGDRVWTSGDFGQSWTLESFTHPLWNAATPDAWVNTGGGGDGGSWTCSSIPRYGCVLGLYSYSDFHSILWRPGS